MQYIVPIIVSLLQDAKNYGWELNEPVDFNWKKLLHNKVGANRFTLLFYMFMGFTICKINPFICKFLY